jgi:protein deglycase
MGTKKAAVFFAGGFEEIEAVAPVDILRRAGVTVDTVSISSNFAVKGARGINIICCKTSADFQAELYDAIILPGGMPGTEALAASAFVAQAVIAHFAQGKLIAANCAAPSVLAALGLLDGRRATCYPSWASKLRGAIYENAPVITHGNIITARGVGASIEFSLAIAAYLVGNEKAEEIGAQILAF